MTLGFEKPLYILPFDHRGSFQTNLFGWKGTLSPAQTAEIAAATKRLRDSIRQAVNQTPAVKKTSKGLRKE